MTAMATSRLGTGAPALFPVAGNDQGRSHCAFLITHHDPTCLGRYTGLGSFGKLSDMLEDLLLLLTACVALGKS